MKISFYGASGEVTGSCYYVETSKARVLVDFGLHQGTREQQKRNKNLPPIVFDRLDAVVLTHAHIDHSGRLPLLKRQKYTRSIYCTPATRDLVDLLLRDSAHIQQADAERMTRRNVRLGKPHVRPLYSVEDAIAILEQLSVIPYEKPTQVAPGVSIRFVDAGHILGSASVEMTIEEPGKKRVVVFSGDIGQSGMPLLRDPTPLRNADLVLMESTYGDRDHRPLEQTIEEAAGIMREAVWNKEKVLIPSFAVGRSQLILYYLNKLARSGRVPEFPVFLDSPMAIDALKLYRKHLNVLDAETREQTRDGEYPLNVPNLTCTVSPDESRKINDMHCCAVVIAGSGMCTGGRIIHHLRHNIWRRNVTVLIVGYQAQGTLGRELVQGASHVRIFGERVIVRATIKTLGGLSAHAGQSELLAWAGNFEKNENGKRPRFVLTHGEPGARIALQHKMMEKLDIEPQLPEWGDEISLD